MEPLLLLRQVIQKGLQQGDRAARCTPQPQPGGAGVFSLTCADYTPIEGPSKKSPIIAHEGEPILLSPDPNALFLLTTAWSSCEGMSRKL